MLTIPEKHQARLKKAGVVRVKGHKTISSLVNSAHHNWRKNDDSDYPHIDLSQTHKNLDLMGATNSAELLELLEKRLATAEYITRNSIRCIEFLITADFDAFSENGGPLKTEKLINKTQELLTEIFGIENIIGFNLQLDEMTPHIVAYVTPITHKPQKTTCKLKKSGTYCDGTNRYIEEYKTKNSYTSLSATYFYDQFGGKGGMQTLFSEFIFEPNGLRRGFYFSKLKHINAKEHKMALREGYSAAMASLEFTPEKIKGKVTFLFKSNENICSALNKIVFENAKAIIAMSAEYKNEKGKRLSLEKTLTITQEKMVQLESEKNKLSSQLNGYNNLSNENQIAVNSYIDKLNKIEKENAQKIIDSKEKKRSHAIEKIQRMTIDEFILLDDINRFKAWRFSLENPELEGKFEELFSSDFFNPEDGSLNEKGKSYKRDLINIEINLSQKDNMDMNKDLPEIKPVKNKKI